MSNILVEVAAVYGRYKTETTVTIILVDPKDILSVMTEALTTLYMADHMDSNGCLEEGYTQEMAAKDAVARIGSSELPIRGHWEVGSAYVGWQPIHQASCIECGVWTLADQICKVTHD
jgi:hypothetical protein